MFSQSSVTPHSLQSLLILHSPTRIRYPCLRFLLSRQLELHSLQRHFSHPPKLQSVSNPPPPPSYLRIQNVPAPHLGHVRIISLDSRHNRNAISKQLLAELGRELDALHGENGFGKGKGNNGRWHGLSEHGRLRDEKKGELVDGETLRDGREKDSMGPSRAVVFASEVDEVFCSGADLKERKEMTAEETNDFLHSLRTAFHLLSTLPIPTISAISSIALGGGLELALASTFRLFASTAVVGLPETRLAIIPGAGGTHRLRNLIGEAKALELILSGRRIRGSEAHRLGVCERVVETVDMDGGTKRRAVLDGAMDFAMEICEGGPLAIGAAMRAVQGARDVDEEKAYASLMGTEDRNEALRAFQEKRKPSFRGR